MKLAKIVNATQALQRIGQNKLPLKLSWRIDQTLDKLERHYQFFARKETEIFQTYKPKGVEGNRLIFETPEDAQGYQEAHKELEELEVEVGTIKPIEIDINSPVEISQQDLKALKDAGLLTVIGAEEEATEESAEGELF